jgi:hypothetical protein
MDDGFFSDDELPIALSPNVTAELQARIIQLPVQEIKTMTDYFAVIDNESRFVHQIGRRLDLKRDDIEKLDLWLVRIVVARLRNVRPESPPFVIPWVVRQRHHRSAVVQLLSPLWSNPVTIGLPSWMSNRRVSLRAMELRLARKH